MSLPGPAYTLTVRQQPERARVYSGTREKGGSTIPALRGQPLDRKTIDPPPIVQLQISDPQDPAHPYYFMCCSLVDQDSRTSSPAFYTQPTPPQGAPAPDSALTGVLVSSLHKLKDTNKTGHSLGLHFAAADLLDSGFFVFPDISVRSEGRFRLQFNLFEMIKEPAPSVVFVTSTTSSVFQVFSPKSFPGMLESTFLSRSFSDQGVRLRVRKEPRPVSKRPDPSKTEAIKQESPPGMSVYREPTSGGPSQLDPAYSYYTAREPVRSPFYPSQMPMQSSAEYGYARPEMAENSATAGPSNWNAYASRPPQYLASQYPSRLPPQYLQSSNVSGEYYSPQAYAFRRPEFEAPANYADSRNLPHPQEQHPEHYRSLGYTDPSGTDPSSPAPGPPYQYGRYPGYR